MQAWSALGGGGERPGALVEGARLGQYRVGARLGQGGMGTVYRAESEAEGPAGPAGAVVALKVFHDEATGAELSWMYRDRRHSGGHTYVVFDADGLVARVQGSMSFGI